MPQQNIVVKRTRFQHEFGCVSAVLLDMQKSANIDPVYAVDQYGVILQVTIRVDRPNGQ